MRRRKWSQKERFTFYNFFNLCLYIYDCKINFDLERLDVNAFKFDQIYLRLDDIKL